MTDPRVSRRRFLGGTALAAVAMGAAAVTHVALPAGPFSLVDDRRRSTSPQSLPVNRSAEEAGVLELAADPDWSLDVMNGDRTVSLGLDDLRGLTQREEELPISCVEGWTTNATWQGVRMSDVLDMVDAPDGVDLRLRSLQQRRAFGVTTMPQQYARDPRTLLALRVNGEELNLDHGYPVRAIAPGRPGVMQTKWLTSIEVLG